MDANQKKPKQAEKSKTFPKCTKKVWCSVMASMLNDAGTHGKGLDTFTIYKLSTMKPIFTGIVYRRATNDRGVMLNCCPWCGEKIAYAKAKKPVRG